MELDKPDTSYFSAGVTRRVKKFHQTLPGFKPTPLARLDNLAEQSGIKSIRVKDESHRCGVNAFKVLGASYALSSYLSQRLNLDPATISFGVFKANEVKNQINELTCITATDGNHGRAVAWAARELGMPRNCLYAQRHHHRAAGKHQRIGCGCRYYRWKL